MFAVHRALTLLDMLLSAGDGCFIVSCVIVVDHNVTLTWCMLCLFAVLAFCVCSCRAAPRASRAAIVVNHVPLICRLFARLFAVYICSCWARPRASCAAIVVKNPPLTCSVHLFSVCCLHMQLQGSAKSIVRRLALLQDFNQLLPSLQRSEAVAGMFRALAAAALPAAAAPTSWWDVECDVALMIGMHRHGYGNFEAVRQDPDLTAAFQVGGLTGAVDRQFSYSCEVVNIGVVLACLRVFSGGCLGSFGLCSSLLPTR